MSTPDKPKQLTLRFGACVLHLKEQLGDRVGPRTAEILELDALAITRLYVGGLLTEGEASAARKRLMRKIEKKIKEKDHAEG